ncbi:MAG: response regulator transcription factor [Glaciecola sp.]|jgi:DNA-binding NarL/FixJ family response regulator
MYQLLVVDDHPIFRQAIGNIIDEKFPGSLFEQAESIEQAQNALQKNPDYDLVLLDLNMPNTSGLNGLLSLRNDYPEVPVVIISAENDKQQILQTISYGAVGFISKSSSVEAIADSLTSIFNGNVCLPSDIIRTASAQNNTQQKSKDFEILPEKMQLLTRKELIVLKYLTQGEANKAIAYEMNISETTVKSHVSSILKKLGATNRVKVVVGSANIDFDQYLKR